MSHGLCIMLKNNLLGKVVEVFLGDVHESLDYSDSTANLKSIIIGELIDVGEECLAIEVRGKGRTSNMKNIIYVNSWSISTICEYKKGVSTFDAFVNAEGRLRK